MAVLVAGYTYFRHYISDKKLQASAIPPPARLAAFTPGAAHLRGIVAGMVRGIIRTGLAGVYIGWVVGGIIR